MVADSKTPTEIFLDSYAFMHVSRSTKAFDYLQIVRFICFVTFSLCGSKYIACEETYFCSFDITHFSDVTLPSN